MQIPTVPVTGVPDPLPEGLAVLDVREQNEWDAGHVDGAVHIPLRELPTRLGEVPDGQQVLVVCRVGGRSAQATAYLLQHDVPAVNLDGGMVEWVASGRPMISAQGGPGTLS